ncbi:MAG: hypothetical protein WBG02_20075 [Candidatus Acidiferrum sp.]
MSESPRETIERANAGLAVLLEGARQALRGERDFNVGDVGRLREQVGKMDSVVAQSSELRRLQPELGKQLDLYKSQLRDLQTLIVQLRVMLHTRQAHLHASQDHNTAVSRWVNALRQTR